MFKDRKEAGIKLAKALLPFRSQDVIVLAIPRGGIVLAHEIAKILNAPLDLIFARKIGHPMQEEYAIAAVSEDGILIGDPKELQSFNPKWLETEKEKTLLEIKRRRDLYLKGRKKPILKDKVVIIVDDGIATGLTLKAAILEAKKANPKKLIVAAAVAPKCAAESIKKDVDEFIGLIIDPESQFLGSVGAYFKSFPQVRDNEVINLL